MPLGASTVKNEPSSYVTCIWVTVERCLLNDHRGNSQTCPSVGTVGLLSSICGSPKLWRISALASLLLIDGFLPGTRGFRLIKMILQIAIRDVKRKIQMYGSLASPENALESP
jgi:hypothetical protein